MIGFHLYSYEYSFGSQHLRLKHSEVKWLVFQAGLEDRVFSFRKLEDLIVFFWGEGLRIRPLELKLAQKQQPLHKMIHYKLIKSWNMEQISDILDLPPQPKMPITTRIITFFAGNPYKQSFVTVTGWGVYQTNIYSQCQDLWDSTRTAPCRILRPTCWRWVMTCTRTCRAQHKRKLRNELERNRRDMQLQRLWLLCNLIAGLKSASKRSFFFLDDLALDYIYLWTWHFAEEKNPPNLYLPFQDQ